MPDSVTLIRQMQHAKKKPVLTYELFLEYGGEGGIDSLRSPFGQSVRCALSLSNWLRQWSNPGRGFSSPRRRATCEKKPVLAYELFLEYGGEGGIDSLRSPFGLARSLRSQSVQLAAPVVDPRSGPLHPPAGVQHAKKKPVLTYELFLEYGGEGGIRTPDTLPYTHFPGVLLQPLGHLTILYCCLTAWGATGRYYRELR